MVALWIGQCQEHLLGEGASPAKVPELLEEFSFLFFLVFPPLSGVAQVTPSPVISLRYWCARPWLVFSARVLSLCAPGVWSILPAVALGFVGLPSVLVPAVMRLWDELSRHTLGVKNTTSHPVMFHSKVNPQNEGFGAKMFGCLPGSVLSRAELKNTQ